MKFSSISPFLGSSYKMTNENVRFFFAIFSATKIHILFEPAILSSKIFLFLYSFLSIR